MKKHLVIIGLLTLGLSTAVHAQDAYKEEAVKMDDEESSKAIHRGVNTVNLYYGPSLITTAFKNVAANDANGVAFSNTGSLGLVYEHLLSNWFGLGAEVGYRSMKMGFTETVNNGNGQNQVYQSTWKFTTLRVMARFNFHWVRTKRFDFYGFVSAGYRGGSNTFTTQNPDYSGKFSYSPIPFGIKPGLGFRYFFLQHVGLNLELAIGTPIICGGISFKF